MKKISRFVAACGLAAAAMTANAETFIGDRTDFRDETIYFAITTRFYDGDPKNNVLCWDGQENQINNNDPCWRGDFAGLIEKLDYIKALGFTAVWITPVVQNGSGFDYHGYHAMDFSRVDLRYESRKEWGSAQDVDFQDLIDAAHSKGMKIILDIVLQHTGNFGENYFCHLFDRDQNIRNQADITACLIPDDQRLGGASYWDLPNEGQVTQYSERFKYLKNTDGQNHDNKNYWHHVANAWNWDDPSRWWGQIAGDCVDLNTENPAVVDYLVECYGKFIEMGVDGFRIDTTGHIAPLTFNSAFIPRFIELGEKYKDKRLNGAPFYMFGECCARFGGVIYRDQHLLSSHYYTWKSDPALVNEWNSFTADWWAQQNVSEGAAPLGNMLTCLKDPGTVYNSDNVFMKNGAWHEPDYSQASGFNVIDFPMHYNFNTAAQAVRIANEGDHFYNDASWNVVYVDSHDYCPGPNDGVRFNGGTAQWAENLSLMFTFRGIPCIYYGSEVEFKKGVTIDKGPDLALINSGRAYYGAYLEGSVTADDFCNYTASGNVQKTLNADLAQHIIRLNQIRAAVPALRKGQYTFDGCEANGGWAFKRAYKNESYALVAINGGATFSDVPAGTYTDIVTGQTYQGGGTITVTAPSTQGQLRVLVKDWTGGKVGEDGKFIYASAPVAKGGSVEFEDPGTPDYYTIDDVIERAAVKFDPAGGTFKSETLTVTASLNEGAETGWFQIAGGARIDLTAGQPEQFTIGNGMSFGESVTVTWSATGEGETQTGSVTYKKVDPNAVITIYVTGKNGADISGTNLYAWNDAGKPAGAWPGTALTETTEVDGRTFYYYTFDTSDPVSIILNRNGAQTGNIEGITEDTYYEYDGGSSATKLDITPGPKAPRISADPASGKQFNDVLNVTLSVSPATDIYYTLDGTQASASSTRYTGPITLTETTTINAYAKNEVGETRTAFTYTKTDLPIEEEWHVYFSNTKNWPEVKAYCWDDNHSGDNAFSGKWPGTSVTETVQWQGKTLYHYSITAPAGGFKNPKVIFNGNGQTGNLDFVNNAIYDADNNNIGTYSQTGVSDIRGEYGIKVFAEGGQLVVYADKDCTVQAVKIDGTVRTLPVTAGYNYYELPKGFYIVANTKVVI